MALSRIPLAVVSSGALVAGLLLGVVPVAQAAPGTPAVPATVTADGDAPANGDAGVDEAAQRRGEKVVDLRDGTCEQAVPLGLVRFDGPGGTRLTARVRAQGDAKLLTIVSGSGRIGENVVRPKNVSGELTWRKGSMTGSVTIKLPEHVRVSRTWAQEVSVNAQPDGCDWLSTVVLQARGDGASLDLRGSLTDGGSYVLRGSGRVSISRTSVPVTGFLRATTPGRSASTTWRVTGSTPRLVRIPGARLSGVKVSLGNTVPIVRGTASLRLDVPLLTAPAVLEVAGANTWRAQVDGSNRRLWIVPQTDQVVVRTGELRGSVGMRSGQAHWTLTAPGAARIDTLDYSVAVGFVGPFSYTVQARGAVGTFLGLPEQRPFLGVPTKLTITPKGITGALTVVTRGEILLDLPTVWRGTTEYILRPVPGAGWEFDSFISHALRAGKGTMRLTGPVSETGGVDLVGSGTLEISGTTVPTRGFYKRSSFTDGSTPVWAMVAYLDEAPEGRIPLKGGAALVGGTLVFNGTGVQAMNRVSPADATTETTTVSVTTTGTTTVQLSDADNDTFYLPVTYSYTDPNNWTATAAGTTPSNVYNPFTGLEIPETDFSGTITDTNGEQTWDVSIAMQDWQEMAKGLDYQGAFTISNECPLSDQGNCPDSEGIFIGGQSTMLFDDSSFPTAMGDGAFLTDLSWGWWDATAQGSVSVNGVTMANPDVTIWRGSGTGPNPQIVMPDLSDLNGNGMNVEFCADFTVPVPYVTTVNTLGCAEWTEQGSILAQVNTGGSVVTGDYNGVTVNSTTLTGYVWNGLDQEETVFLDGVEIAAEPDRSYLTADIVVPGNAMHDFGTGSSADTVIEATGWFDNEGNFDLEGTIPVNLKGGGFTLEEIIISIGRQKENAQSTFDLRFDAESDVAISGNHFPLDVYIGYQKAGDATITVGLSATGTKSTQPDGTMDFVNLIPSGDFEPENASLVDGSFDGKLQPNVFDDGGFERSVDPGDVAVNGGFDDGAGLNVLPNGDFESGAFGNMLANPGFEDTNILRNGDFEENGGSLLGWFNTSGSSTPQSTVAGTATGPDEEGSTIAKLGNSGLSKNTLNGMEQVIDGMWLNGSTVTMSVWVTGTAASSSTFTLTLGAYGCSPSVPVAQKTVTVTNAAWQQVSVQGKYGSGCSNLQVVMAVFDSGTSVYLDAGQLSLAASTYTSAPNVWRPNVVGTFDSLSSSPLLGGYSSNVSIASDYPRTLYSNGSSTWLTTATAGNVDGSFDISYKVLFPTGTSSREIANFGFWMNGGYANLSGYCFRLQTSHGDGGFFQCSPSTKTYIGNAKAPDLARGKWYQVRLTATHRYVTAYVTDAATGALVFTDTVFIGTASKYGGAFGQVQDGASTSQGIRWDDLTLYTLENESTTYTAPPNIVWLGIGDAHSGSGRASLYSGSAPGAPFQYSTGETPVTGGTYTYSAWVRAAGGTVSGTITLDAVGSSTSADQRASKSFSVGTTWTPISITSYITGSGYTDLRPGLTLSTANVELYLDDQVLQQVPWLSNTGNSIVKVTSDEAHGGTNSLEVINPSSSDLSNAFYGFSQMPAPGSVVTATAWVKSPAGVQGYFFLSEGANTQVSTTFTGTGEWQQLTVTKTMQGGLSFPNVGVDILSGFAGKSLYVDDVTVTVAGVSSSQTGNLGAPSPPAGWQSGSYSPSSNSYTNPKPVIVVDPALARSAPAAMVIQPSAGGTIVNSYSVTPSIAPAVGSTWQVSVWLASGTADNSQTATVTITAGSTSQVSVVELPSTALQYTNAVVQLPITSSTATFVVQINYKDSSGKSPVYVDDLSITEVGLSPADRWMTYVPNQSGYFAVEAIGDDPANAQSGDGYVIFSNKASQSSAVYFDTTNYQPRPGTEHEMSFWVRSPSGTVGAVQAVLHTFDAQGYVQDSYAFGFTATTTWQQIFLSLPITKTAGTLLRTEFDLPPGATIWVDNIESRDIDYWSAVQPAGGKTSIAIEDNASDAANGQNHLRFVTSGAGGGVGDAITADVDGNPIQVVAGSSYKLEAYVRSTTGAAVSGNMSLTAASGSATTDSVSVPFTADGGWTPVQLTLDTTKSGDTLIPQIVLGSGGQLDVDELTLVPVIIEQSDPWSATGSGVTWNVMDDPENAYDSSYGVMEFSVAEAGTGVQHAASQVTSVGDQLSATAFVRTGGANVSGTFVVTSQGGSKETWQQSFSATGEWQEVSVPITIAQSGHTGFTVQVLSDTPGTTLYLDQVALQANPWTPSSGVTQAIVFDGSSAQSGSGYLRLTPTGSSGGSSYIDMAASSDMGGTYPAGSTWEVTAYVRSSSETSLATGSISLGVSGETPTTQAFSVGPEWTAVPVSVTVGSSALDSLRVTVSANGGGAPVEIDSVTLSDGTPDPDGITTPLPHPEDGWVYLWDDAFGVPGLHLWAISAQVDFVDGEPGLGVSATAYQDPTKVSRLMSGTDWMKGDFAVNISETDPCFLFDFSSGGGNSGVSIGEGVFTAKDYSINFAPRGCQVGPQTLPKGASLSFDGQLGDGTVAFDVAIVDGEDGPEFTESIGITDITIGGFSFKESELSILLTPTDDSITFVGDMVTPMGNFDNAFDLSANESGLVMDGSVSLSDWEWAGGGFDVEELDFDMSMTVPFGAGECGSFSADTRGLMDMAQKTSLSFTGDLAMDCGRLKVLELDYDYYHGGVKEIFELKYDSSTGILAGDVEFDFERSTSWKFLTHRYNRHPKFAIKLAYSMDVANPGAAASAAFSGNVTLSGGSGTISCTIKAGSGSNWADDQCSLDVEITVGGGHTYKSSW